MRAGAKVGAFVVGLVVVGAAGAGVGAVAGPIDTAGPDGEAAAEHGDDHQTAAAPSADDHAEHGADDAGGDDHAADGYRLELEPLTDDLAFTVVGPDGHAVTEVEVRHTKSLHLIVVGRDLVTYAHLHPAVDGDGTWSTPAPDLPPGSYRVVADVVPSPSANRGLAGDDGPDLALAADLTVPGSAAAVDVPAPSATAEVDGLTATLTGEPAVGGSDLSFTLSRGGVPVAPEPYLGARGHLVAFRATDLAYSHVHPHEGDGDGDGTPVGFTATFRSGGTHRLFLDVQVDGVVRTFAFTVEVADRDHH